MKHENAEPDGKRAINGLLMWMQCKMGKDRIKCCQSVLECVRIDLSGVILSYYHFLKTEKLQGKRQRNN